MPDLEQLMQGLQTPEFIIGAAMLLLLIPVVLALRAYLRRTADVRLMRQVFARHGEEYASDVVLPDGLDGFMFADYLLLLRGKILLLKVIDRRGVVLGMDDGEEWTCIENNRTEKFANPLTSLRQTVLQLRHALGFDAIDAGVLFGSGSEFPRGAPEGVLQLAALDEQLSAAKGKERDQEQARHVWQKLNEMREQARLALEQELG